MAKFSHIVPKLFINVYFSTYQLHFYKMENYFYQIYIFIPSRNATFLKFYLFFFHVGDCCHQRRSVKKIYLKKGNGMSNKLQVLSNSNIYFSSLTLFLQALSFEIGKQERRHGAGYFFQTTCNEVHLWKRYIHKYHTMDFE